MSWLLLVVGGLFEIGFTTCLNLVKQTSGTPMVKWWMTAFFICLAISMYLLYYATKQIPLGTAYAVWTGIGAVGTVLMGIFFFKEPADFWRIFFIFTLIASIIGLKFVSH